MRLPFLRQSAVLALLIAAAPPAVAEPLPGKVVVLQGMDKVTARVWTLNVAIDGVVRFGTLEIVPRHCTYTPPTERLEDTAFLEIYEARSDRPRRKLFSGWMLASSPGLNALEHPVYDVGVVDCLPEAAKPESETPDERQPKPGEAG